MHLFVFAGESSFQGFLATPRVYDAGCSKRPNVTWFELNAPQAHPKWICLKGEKLVVSFESKPKPRGCLTPPPPPPPLLVFLGLEGGVFL